VQFAECVTAQRRIGSRPVRFTVVGGGTRSALWLRLIATALQEPLALIARSDVAGPAGAARLAAVAAGAPVATLLAPVAPHSVIEPDQRLDDVIKDRHARISALMTESQ
jgi:xylulokinase